MKDISLSNQSLAMTISGENGAIIGLESRLTGWKVLDRPSLGLSFRFLVPLSEELRNNPVLGEKQRPSRITTGKDGSSVTVEWEELQSERGGLLPIGVVASIRMTERQALFTMSIDNRSPYTVENVYYPYLGDVGHPENAEWLKTFIYQYATAQQWNLWPTYENLRGYYGSDFPVQFAPSSAASGNPMSPYILLRSETEGLYVGAAEDSTEYVTWHTELRPGWGDSIDSRCPDRQVVSGKDVQTRFAGIHMPHIKSGESRALVPIALEAYTGDWHQGVDIHRRRVRESYVPATPPDWAREPHAWLQIHINSPEDELRTRFVDLPRIGEECARHGVKAIQLVGWNDGGQDQGNPSHSPDPRLGTFGELKEAVAKIRSMGVKVILFAKFTWADRATEWFRTELNKYAIKDPYGDYYVYPGYQYQTATQFMDINTKRLIPMCFLSEEYLRICEAEFEKILDLEPDGFLFDECLHHTPALLCFDESHGHRRAAPVYANDNVLIERFARISKSRNPDFLFAGEACYDREMAVYQLSYHRSPDKQHIPLARYVFPHAQYMTAITGFNDRNMINQCLLYRYVMSYEPYNFKGSLEDFPLTLDYGKKMDALRSELRDYFWDGEFRYEQGAEVVSGGKPHHPFSVFLSSTTKQAAVVVANYEAKAIDSVSIKVASGSLTRWRLIDEPKWQEFTGSISIPRDSCAVVVP